ncbi:MAG: ABC transporter ATP-binding protein/permease [Defluviitaleaceae bacterium]|nr:ABC transporter ATP-binding protein/permease [Defluviitaleaceae bacterium]
MNEFEEQEYSKEFEFSLWKKLFFHLREHKNLVIKVAICFLGLAVVETVMPMFSQYAIDTFIVGGSLETLPSFLSLYFFFIFLFSFFVFGFVMNAGKLEGSVTHTIRKKAFARLQELSYSFFDTTPVGYITARLTSDAQRLGGTIAWALLEMVWSIAIMIFMIIVMLFHSPFLTLLVVLTMPILYLLTRFFRKLMLTNQRLIRKQNSKITAAFAEGINAARTTKTLIREQKNYEEFSDLTSGMRKLSIRATVLSAAFYPIIVLIANIVTGLVLWHGGVQFLDGEISIGTVSLFLSYGVLMFEPIQQIARVFSEVQSAQASAERTVALIETEPDIIDSEEAIEKYGSLLAPKQENWPIIKGDIKFENVSFSYKTGETVLENFNLHIKAGEKIALVGETGSGKSTIINLVCHFYEPTSGRILIDDIDYTEYSQILVQSNLGYVLQAPHLFNGTIMENIRYGKLEATDEEVKKAAEIVNATNFIEQLEHGFNTQVGEGGSKISTGEKQLISFARAILKNPKIFVLDEATSSIDTVTEQIIQKAVDKTLEGRTSFIVAHRLSTIRSSDRILVIKKGKILEQGSHKELLKEKGYYYDLYTNQFTKEESEKILGL